MRLIIYLASSDVVAIFNTDRLRRARAESGIYSRRNLQLTQLTVEENNSAHTYRLIHQNTNNQSILNSISSSERMSSQIDLVAHGEGGYRLKCITQDEPPNIFDITTAMLKEFFDAYAYDSISSTYKFSALTLFCCEGYRFGKELSQLLPDIKITCFNEDIRIDDNGHAYPYRLVNNCVSAIGKDGQDVDDHSLQHYRCPLHIIHGRENLEKTIYDGIEAVPTHLQQLPRTLLADNSVEIIGNFFELNHTPRDNVYPEATASASSATELPDFDINLLHVEDKSDDQPTTDETSPLRRRL